MHKANESAADALAELNKDNNGDIKQLRRRFFRDQDMARVKCKLVRPFDSICILTQSSHLSFHTILNRDQQASHASGATTSKLCPRPRRELDLTNHDRLSTVI